MMFQFRIAVFTALVRLAEMCTCVIKNNNNFQTTKIDAGGDQKQNLIGVARSLGVTCTHIKPDLSYT